MARRLLRQQSEIKPLAGRSPRERAHTFVRDKYWEKHRDKIAYSSGTWYAFDGRWWQQKPEFEVQNELQAIIDNDRKLSIQASAATLNSITNLLRIRCSWPDKEFDSVSDLINFQDCTLEISTRQRRAFDKKDHLTSAFPFAYDPEAKSDVWEMFLDKVIPNDCRTFLQEFAGYCLTTDTLHETSVWFLGPAGCGKSTFIEGIRAAMGDRVTTFSINNLESRFGVSHLRGKTLAISAEQPASLRQAQILNQLISGEGITVERKYQNPFEMFNRAKFLWAMNEQPRVYAKESGLTRRVVIIKFAPLPESERDDTVKRQIIRSGPAIFNWMMEGLDRLTARGKFERPQESASVLKLVTEADPQVEP